MTATPPNRVPAPVTKRGRGIIPKLRSSNPKPVSNTGNKNWVFRPELVDQTTDYIFICPACTGFAPTPLPAPVLPFIEAIINQPPKLEPAKVALRDKFRSLVPQKSARAYFSSEMILNIGDQLVKSDTIPFNPFRRGTEPIRERHAAELAAYGNAYRAHRSAPAPASTSISESMQAGIEAKLSK